MNASVCPSCMCHCIRNEQQGKALLLCVHTFDCEDQIQCAQAACDVFARVFARVRTRVPLDQHSAHAEGTRPRDMNGAEKGQRSVLVRPATMSLDRASHFGEASGQMGCAAPTSGDVTP